MKNQKSFVKVVLSATAAIVAATVAYAFPPAPHHLIKGTVRDEMGYPIEVAGTVVLKTVTGVVIQAPLTPALFLDASYRIEVPMDAGVTPDSYKPTALNPLVPFTMEIKIGSKTYLPFEMSGDLSALGEAGGTTVVDLTLGADSDGDGIPDAWELSLISRTDRLNSLADVNPDDDLDGDGLSNYAEYLARTYAYDVLDALALRILAVTDSEYVIQFLAVSDHGYTVFGSSNMKDWTQQSFKLATDSEEAGLRTRYDAEDVQVLEIRIPRAAGDNGVAFFNLYVN